MAKGKEILRGISGAPGIVTVTLIVVKSDPGKIAGVKPGHGVVGERFEPSDDEHITKAAALITDTGGRTSHAAVLGRALGIPAVVGTVNATSVLKDGQKVVVDGMVGYMTDPVTGKQKPYGAVYEWVPDPPSAVPSPAEVAAKMGIKLNQAVLDKLAQLQK